MRKSIGLSALNVPAHYNYVKDLFKVCYADKDTGRVDCPDRVLSLHGYEKELNLYRIFQASVKHNDYILHDEL
jgi:hypothetical protein